MPKILNNLLCSLMIFSLAFLWVYFCLKDVMWALICALIITAAFAYILWRITSKWEDGKKIKQKRKKEIVDFTEYLKFYEDNAQLFADLFRFYLFNTELIDYDNFIARKNGKKYYVAICFEQDTLSKERLRQAVISAKRSKADKLYIFANKTEPAQEKIAASHIDSVFIDGVNTYELFEQCDKLPAFTRKSVKKTSFIGKYAFCKQRFWWYFSSCIFMVIISVFSFFPWYTLSWATVMFVLAVYSLFNKRYNSKKTQVSLD